MKLIYFVNRNLLLLIAHFFPGGGCLLTMISLTVVSIMLHIHNNGQEWHRLEVSTCTTNLLCTTKFVVTTTRLHLKSSQSRSGAHFWLPFNFCTSPNTPPPSAACVLPTQLFLQVRLWACSPSLFKEVMEWVNRRKWPHSDPIVSHAPLPFSPHLYLACLAAASNTQDGFTQSVCLQI